MTTATARAHPNIALVKYWGKRDEELMLPAAGSLSLTLDAYATTTTVSLDPSATEDRFVLGGAAATPGQTVQVTRFLDLVRARAGSAARADSSAHAVVDSRNEAPTGAGLASSASGFAALAVAAAAAYGLDLDRTELSRLARRGSGSATRSLVAGLGIWHAGDDDASSFAEPIEGPEMSMVIVTVDPGQKKVSSREGMRRTAATSPYYSGWVDSTARSLEEMSAACRAGDFTRVGEITESNALRMHAAIEACEPPIRYLRSTSVAVFDAVEQLRTRGIEAYATADAGPNVVVISRPAEAEAVAEHLADHGDVRIVGAGPGAHLIPTEESA
ncbi:diphosphomevalonate decarboxylase [Brachybacterium sp. P6-10-X1]|uniref:diphosphomevalonate decarboxylase n=1 Tax=Brachybacterium sp. P6-10-X1 TaxID=1903186 RepID=UPI0009718D6A|nr:diphosphomevalonate decarboxylase [Brachybacterium sp. P6-10-X1]APX33271.1 diphosphomevalonate decarboxylase [Brachybacterium sp. P6-10-X1]